MIMKRAILIAVLMLPFIGCKTDIVTTKQLKAVKNRCVCIQAIESQDPYVGKVIRDILEKELVRKRIQVCDANSANVIITGSTFLTTRGEGHGGLFGLGKSDSSAQAIESVSISAKDTSGNILMSGSYANTDQFTASKLAQEFGSALADKLR